jgi:hypothetical protein
MKFVFVAVVALALLSVVVATGTECHPECRWQCDDPVCPAKCHPVCERPKCQVQCEETECAKCKVNCDKPKCNVRCPKDMCEKDTCPKCETVCAPAVCHTSCVAPEPKCTPMCEETKCDWKCAKPTLCPKPKCELVCDAPKCASALPTQIPTDINPLTGLPYGYPVGQCGCQANNVLASIAQASSNVTLVPASLPSFVEVMHSIKHAQQEGATPICACAQQH